MCPFIDKGDARCAEKLTFRNVVRAFTHCADHYRDCPIYQQLTAERRNHDVTRRHSQLLAAS